MRTPAETARCFGGGLKANALSVYLTRNIRPNAKLIVDALARGEDPIDTVPIGSGDKVQGGNGQVFCFLQLQAFIMSLYESSID